MPDLTSAMESFQKALLGGAVSVQPGALDSKLFLHMDRPNGEPRLTYVRLKGKTVTAFVTFIQCEPVEGERCYNVGWAVPERFQKQGRAAEAFNAAANELRQGLARYGVSTFYVEAVVGTDNVASQRVAERVISPPVKTDMDCNAGVPIIQYLRKIEVNTDLNGFVNRNLGK